MEGKMEKKRRNLLKAKRRKKEKVEQLVSEEHVAVEPQVEKKMKKSKEMKKRKKENGGEEVEVGEVVEQVVSEEDAAVPPQVEKKSKKLRGMKKRKKENACEEVEAGEVQQTVSEGEPEKTRKKKKKDRVSSKKGNPSIEERSEEVAKDVYHISSGDEDCSKGMKKWIREYHQSRPGLEVLQQQIDEFITAHEERKEEERQKREAEAAEDGFTVVKHHKGRTKTTDTGSGTTVGAVAQAAVLDKMANKKSKEVGVDFYRFQKREAQRNEIMMLQSKFEQDRKRIQQLRAARKFRPY